MKTKLMMMATAVAMAFGAWADTETVGGYTWTYRINGDTAGLLGGKSGQAISPGPSGHVTIPSVLGGKPVTSIGSFAFFGCSGLTSVTIPDSVTSIGHMAFEGTAFFDNQPDGLVVLGHVVYKMKGTCPASVTIPDGVTSIADGAFYGCSGLASVTIPDSVMSIGEEAFSGCSGLAQDGFIVVRNVLYGYTGAGGNVIIPDNVTSIGSYAFDGCSGLTSVTISDGVTSIGSSAFSGCSGLTSVTIPDSVTSIGEYAFGDCESLASVTIGNGVTSIGEAAFPDNPACRSRLYRTIFAPVASPSVVTTVVQQVSTTVVQQVESPYALTNAVADRAIASVTVDANCSIDSFVLKDGKVYDTMLRIVNTADHDVKLTLPAGNVYETFKGVKPLIIPANSRSMFSITRTADKTFLVSREELETIE